MTEAQTLARLQGTRREPVPERSNEESIVASAVVTFDKPYGGGSLGGKCADCVSESSIPGERHSLVASATGFSASRAG